jgi:glycine C-acetyltransferase/8-amino-7-oxononanoate synthase
MVITMHLCRGNFRSTFIASGAYVVGSATFIEYLLNSARSFIYSTAPPPAIAAAACIALAVMRSEPQRLTRLWRNRAYFIEGLAKLGYRVPGSVSPIIPIHVGDARMAMSLSARLFDLGIFAPAIRPPTVPHHTSRIRTTVTSEHTAEQLDTALAAFDEAGRQLGLLA